MKTQSFVRRFGAPGLIGVVALLNLPVVSAHCDRLDGPVVTAARAALAEGKPDQALVWVAEGDEAEIRRAFEATIAVRKLGPDARALADRYFFETLVRIHRAGEGAPFTGLKPAGADPGPAVAGADAALDQADVAPLLGLVSTQVEHGVRERFQAALAARKKAASGDVAAGREAVRAYVDFLHYVDGVHRAAEASSHAHPGEAGAGHLEP